MRRANIELTGTKELQAALREFGLQADREIEAIVRGTAQNIRTHAIKSILRGTKSGVTYEKTNPKRKHRASAAGEPPASDTGRLANAITANIEGKSAEIVAGTEYAAHLEFGTLKMEPRPFLTPAVELERHKWDARLNALVDKAARGIIK